MLSVLLLARLTVILSFPVCVSLSVCEISDRVVGKFSKKIEELVYLGSSNGFEYFCVLCIIQTMVVLYALLWFYFTFFFWGGGAKLLDIIQMMMTLLYDTLGDLTMTLVLFSHWVWFQPVTTWTESPIAIASVVCQSVAAVNAHWFRPS